MSVYEYEKYESKKVGTPWQVDGKYIGRKSGLLYDATIMEYVRAGEAKVEIKGRIKDMVGREVKQTWTATLETYKLRKPLLKD